MAFDVHIHVSFEGDYSDVAYLALRFEKSLSNEEKEDIEEDSKEVFDFLKDLVDPGKKCYFSGSKGTLVLWGMVGNYTSPDAFVEFLKPFWKEYLVRNREHHHILVFWEYEQSEQANAIEISLKGPFHSKEGWDDIVIQNHKMPFAWMQY